MKITDYAPRTSPFDSLLKGKNLVGVEVGVDVGAHAHSLLQFNSNIDLLYLIDPWEREYCKGYCEGRLASAGFRNRFFMIQKESLKTNFLDGIFDFVYIDQKQDYKSVFSDLDFWYNKLKFTVDKTSVLGLRNYKKWLYPELVEAVDKFIKERNIQFGTCEEEVGEIYLMK